MARSKGSRGAAKSAPAASTDPLELDEQGDQEGAQDEGEQDEGASEPEAEKPKAEQPKAKPKAAAKPKAGKKQMLARIKKFDPKQGQLTKNFSYGGQRFREGAGWYLVGEATAEHLKTVRCSDMDPRSQLAFQVCTAEEAAKIDVEELRPKGKGSAADPIKPT